MDKISIIIPVYNVEPYIKKCLESVINQTYTNLEILCINDGSTDNSGKICEDYAKQDKRIRVFHKANGGLSSARNIGLRNFTGDYIGFVDSDDWIEPNMYELLYNLAKEKDVAVSVAGFSNDTDTATIPRNNVKPISNAILTQKEMLSYVFKLNYYNAFHIIVCNKLYSAGIFLRNNVFFDEQLKFGEDNLFTPTVFLTDGCTGAYIDRSLYHYYQRPTSLMNSTAIQTKSECIFRAFNAVIKLFTDNGYDDLVPLVKKEYCYNASLLAEEAIAIKNERMYTEMQKKIQLYFTEYKELTREYPERIERVRKLLEG